MSVPKEKVDSAEKKKLHQELYGKQVDEEGKFHHGPHANYDAARLQEQFDCEHPCNCLLYTSDAADE